MLIQLQRMANHSFARPKVLSSLTTKRSKHHTHKYDVAIIGAGAMGLSCAYWLQKKSNQSLNIAVIERDPTYARASTPLSVGGVRQQFSLAENIQLSLFSAEFFRNIHTHLGADVDIQFKRNGYLLLATKRGAHTLMENVKLQNKLGANVELLSSVALKKTFPWLNVDEIECGSLGLANEGWFDPWSLLSAFKRANVALGTSIVHKSVSEVNVCDNDVIEIETTSPIDGDSEIITCNRCVITSGYDTGRLFEKTFEKNPTPICTVPIEPRKRYVYCFECRNGLPRDSPMVIDNSGVYFRREGTGPLYICGKSPDEGEPEPCCDNLDVDYEYFTERLWPLLAHRASNFNEIKLKSAWAGYYDYNSFDQNGIVGAHARVRNLYIAAGFSGHGIQQSPAVGRAIAELIVDGSFTTIDLTKLGLDRIANNTLMLEQLNSERIRDKMYVPIHSAHACFRRLNATHQIGCSSQNKGSTGVIHVVASQDDINWVTDHADAGPYVLVLAPEFFTRQNVVLFKKNYPEKIAGVVLTNTTRPEYYSQESACPNERSQLNDTCDPNDGWNFRGTNLLHESFPFPIFLLNNETEIGIIKEVFTRFNAFNVTTQAERQLSAIELNSFMLAAINTQVCMRRSNNWWNFVPVNFCDPLGDRNIWVTLKPIAYENVDPNVNDEKYILLVTHLDSTTMFDGVTPGAANPISGLVTYLSTIFLLKKMLTDKINQLKNDNLLFVVFNGESYDYIGSQKFVYDMESGNFPLKRKTLAERKLPNITFSNIKLIVELDQISDMNMLSVFHTHYADVDANETIENFVKNMEIHAAKYNVNVKQDTLGVLPPSSIQTFLKKGGARIPGIVITDHDNHYRNRYYNSIFDNEQNLNYTYYNLTNGSSTFAESAYHVTPPIPTNSIQKYLSNVTHVLAQTIYAALINETYSGPIVNTDILVDELIYCYLISPNCVIFNAVISENANLHLPKRAMNLYVGVNTWLNTITTLTGYTLALFSGDINTNITQETCTAVDKIDDDRPSTRALLMWNIWMNGLNESVINASTVTLPKGVCVQSTMHFTAALSPAFEIQDYDWQSGEYSTWSESVWHEFRVRVFLRPSKGREVFTLSLGVILFSTITALIYFVSSKSHILFSESVTV